MSEDGSSSFISEEEAVPYRQSKEDSSQALVFQNERLQQLNRQLQESFEGMKNQLKEAITFKSSVDSMGKELNDLREKYKEITNQNQHLERKIQNMQNLSQKNAKESQEIIEKLTDDRNSAVRDYQYLCKKLTAHKSDRDALIADIEGKESILTSKEEAIQILNKKKRKLEKQLSVLSSQYNELRLNCTEQDMENQKLISQNHEYLQEIEELKLKLGAQKAICNGNDNAINNLTEDIKNKVGCITAFEDTITLQKKEIELLYVQKSKITELLKKTYMALCKSEECTISLAAEKAKTKNTFSANNKKAFKIHPDIEFSLNDLSFPLNGEFSGECRKIMKYDHYRPHQKLQLIINEAAKIIKNLEENVAEQRQSQNDLKSQCDENEKRSNMYHEALVSLLKDLKGIAINESRFVSTVNCKEDRAFISYVASKCSELDPIIKKFGDNPQYIPSHFFFSEEAEDRCKTIMNLLQPNDETFNLFVSQFLINAELKKQITKFSESLGKFSNPSGVLEAIGVSSVDQIPDVVGCLKQQCEKLKEKKNNLRKALKRANIGLKQRGEVDTDAQHVIKKLTLANDALKSELEVLRAKNQVITNENIQKNQELKDLEERLLQIEKDKIEEKEYQYNNQSEEKQAEIEFLQEQNIQLKKALGGASSIQANALRRQKESLNQIISNLQNQLKGLEQEYKKSQNKYKNRVRSLKNKNEKAISILALQYEEAKDQFNKSLAEMNEKGKNSKEISQNILSSLTESEKQIKLLISENTDLKQANKSLEIQISTCKDQLIKERQNAQSQITAQSLMNESRLQERIIQIKKEFSDKRREIVDSALKTIGSVYNIDNKHFDDQLLDQLFCQAQKDLEKLKVFQSSAPTYSRI